MLNQFMKEYTLVKDGDMVKEAEWLILRKHLTLLPTPTCQVLGK